MVAVQAGFGEENLGQPGKLAGDPDRLAMK